MIDITKLVDHQVISKIIEMDGSTVLNSQREDQGSGIDPKNTDEPTFSVVPNCEFHNGIIEVKVLSKFLADAPALARGFIGIAFRISDDFSKYESIYIRPDNGSCDDQIRRNHSIQYYAYPHHKWFVLREDEPKKYETYTDMSMNEWIDLKIVVEDERAELYINGALRPNLIVKDMKHGRNLKGSIALWTEIGTEAYFKDLNIITKD